ncbi:Uncharacterised protein [Mycobacteroides abscessus subsp. abscessus]|uniref:hypothetical protein n=1 Tax=Mycobacteroides abscessus TaxID=36809 RepID=UPI0009D0C8E5|nr:hypothetical protein [Mycobacteroides abscessus]SLE75956.1 Uncharacterised protein [Mycobacteroides abscessus subsp. abscessus]SLF23100.1 Uncharacterised protein [Mycobacteroides abscessus subsp. abscessus]SLF82311.1 Uncharacterised protein [Mycobacteroides abscessus subsp. abscessus]SLG67760.1 Uncharacterised protein [Mycobacteroides abscessus subsp. abscessus]
MGRQVQPDAWESKTHQAIYNTAQAFNSGVVTSNAKRFTDQAAALQEAIQVTGKKIQEIVGQQWRGQTALAVQTSYTKLFENLNAYGEKMLAFGNALPTVGFAMDTAKSKIEPPMSGDTEKLGKTMGLSGEELSKKKAEDEAYARSQMVSLFSNPAVQTGNNTQDIDDTTPVGAGNASGNIQSQGGGSGGAGGGGGSQSHQSPSGAEGLASKDTKPQLAGSDGQQGGAGQGQSGGQGAGSGGGAPGGGQGSGSGGLGSGLGSGAKDSGTGLPVGATTAAGFSPSATGTGPGGAGPGSGVAGGGLSGLRGGGLPGGATAGSGSGGVNPAGVSAAGVRGIGGPMGMMGGAGAHGKGGKENDDDHATPELLKNLDNSEEWLGERRTFIPGGVLGDFKAAEDADKQALEAEKRRFKSIGWNVKFSDEEDGGKR